jgi:UDP-N-acetylmuramoyl-tripeptide--D-alanyl-D-alanine ligase
MKIEELYQRFLETGSISTDTRQIRNGSIFFALRGEKFNGNEFAVQALEKGAVLSIVDEASAVSGDRIILVDDVLKTLQELATHHRKTLNIPVIGLTGSNGKTTSKELANTVLGKKFRTYATKGNLNNHIGVPLTILSIDKNCEIAVIEMGANHLGEIALLCSIAQPTHGFITNIGKAHIGTFGGFDNIVRGKSELYQYLLQTGGIVFVNSQSEILFNMAKRFRDPITYPAKGDYYHSEFLSADPYVKLTAENGDEIQTQLLGKYNFENIAAALCIGKYFGVDAKAANEGVAEYVPGNMRSQVITKRSNTIILDAYNANPSSMKAAIENLAAMKASRKILIVGDMFELEEEAEKEHQQIGKLIQQLGFNEVYLCGSLMKVAQLEIPSAKHYGSKEDLISALKENKFADSTILIKASRGIGLESVVDHL